MIKIRLLYITIFLISFSNLYANVCNIFIHGYTNSSEGYWGEQERQVYWDSNKDHKEAAIEVAKKILIESKSCGNAPIVLRAHSYGVAVTFYILGQGNRFSKIRPNHDFVKVQMLTTALYSYSGAYNGTPIMDLICGNNLLGKITSYFNKKCVKSLTTSSLFHPSNEVTNPGVPVYLIYTTNSHDYGNTVGTLIGANGIPFWQWLKGKRNQNDSVLPTYSTRACSSTNALTRPDQNCEKIDSNFFIDFKFDSNYTHNEYLDDSEFILDRYENE